MNRKEFDEQKKTSDKPTSLDCLHPGDRCRVVKILGEGEIHRRIMDIGIYPGVEILVERVAPLGDPVEFKLKGCHVSLRREEAENIIVDLIVLHDVSEAIRSRERGGKVRRRRLRRRGDS